MSTACMWKEGEGGRLTSWEPAALKNGGITLNFGQTLFIRCPVIINNPLINLSRNVI